MLIQCYYLNKNFNLIYDLLLYEYVALVVIHVFNIKYLFVFVSLSRLK